MYVDAVEIEFGDDGVTILVAWIDVEYLEFQCPVGLLGVVIAEGSDGEILHGAAVLQFEDGVFNNAALRTLTYHKEVKESASKPQKKSGRLMLFNEFVCKTSQLPSC